MRSRSFVIALLLAGSAVAAAAQEPRTFPDLEFAGADGGGVRLSQLKGNVVLLNVWATWCGPCRLELPIVQRFYDQYSDRNFVVVAVNIDAERRRIAPFLKRYNISLPVYYATPEDAAHARGNHRAHPGPPQHPDLLPLPGGVPRQAERGRRLGSAL